MLFIQMYGRLWDRKKRLNKEEKIFQHIKGVDQCYYYDGHFTNTLPHSVGFSTWKNIGSTPRESIEDLAWVLASGQSLGSLVTENSLTGKDVIDSLSAHIRSVEISKADLKDNSIFSYIPTSLLQEFCDVKNKVTKYVIKNFNEIYN